MRISSRKQLQPQDEGLFEGPVIHFWPLPSFRVDNDDNSVEFNRTHRLDEPSPPGRYP